MKAKLVKFDDDGTKCNNDINYLRRHPECGIPFIQDKPLNLIILNINLDLTIEILI